MAIGRMTQGLCAPGHQFECEASRDMSFKLLGGNEAGIATPQSGEPIRASNSRASPSARAQQSQPPRREAVIQSSGVSLGPFEIRFLFHDIDNRARGCSGYERRSSGAGPPTANRIQLLSPGGPQLVVRFCEFWLAPALRRGVFDLPSPTLGPSSRTKNRLADRHPASRPPIASARGKGWSGRKSLRRTATNHW